jgi:Tol biopolymer transport system component
MRTPNPRKGFAIGLHVVLVWTVLGAVTSARQGAPPVARNVVVTTQEGTATAGVLPATDANGDSITFTIVTPPTRGTLLITNAATGAFSYTPNAAVTGYDSFTFRAADAGGSSTAVGSVFIVASTPRWPGQTVRASVASDGTEQNGASTLGVSLSADGRYVAFSSAATNLTPGVTPGCIPGIGCQNVYVRDRLTGQTTMASRASGGGPGIGGALPVLSPDGRYVAFSTVSTALPGGHPDGAFDAVLHDRLTGVTERISVASNGTPGNFENGLPVLSADARYVAFYGTATNLVAADTDDDEDVYLRDRQTGQTTLESVSSAGIKGNSNSWRVTISADGRFIAFNSEATNLVANDTNGAIDLFVRDLQTRQTARVSVSSSGAQANGRTMGALSAGGRFVLMTSSATNLVAGDTNGVNDVFVHDRQTGQTTRVSVSSTGAQANGDSDEGTMSADGRFVAFRSAASNLVPGDTNGLVDDFVHDRQTGQTVRVSVASDGTQANAASLGDDDGCCIFPAMSDDGRSVAITSLASNLVAGDGNGMDDVFVVGPVLVSPRTVDVPGTGGEGNVNVSFDYPGTPWTATTTAPWITLGSPAGGSANGSVSFTAAPNGAQARTATIIVALQAVTISQPAVTTPQPPTGLFASSIVGNRLTLRFTPPAAGPTPTGFSVEGGVNPGEVLASIPTGGTAPFFTLDNAPSGAFYVRVRTVTAAGTSGPSNEIRVFINTPAAPSAPTNLLATVNGTSVALAWENTAAGGAATSMMLDATGSFIGSLPVPLGDRASFDGVPPGTYTISLRAVNAAGSSGSSNPVTLTVPGNCSGAPLAPVNLVIAKVGATLSLFWGLPESGPAPTGFVIDVTGTFNGAVPLAERTITAAVGPGTYNISVRATNACGMSQPTAVQTVVVP